MNPDVIESLKSERSTLVNQQQLIANQIAGIDSLIALTTEPLFTSTQTVSPKTNGHTNGNGTNGHAAKELVNLSRPNGTTRKPLPVPARARRGPLLAGQKSMMQQIVDALPNKPLTSAQFFDAAKRVFPKLSKESSAMHLNKAFTTGKLTRTGERGGYVYSLANGKH